MKIGPLRHRVTVQRQGRVADGVGGYSEVWVNHAPLWAERALPTGRVAPVAQQLMAIVTAEFRARYRDDIHAGMRLVHGSETYCIEAALPDNRGALLRLLCSTVTA